MSWRPRGGRGWNGSLYLQTSLCYGTRPEERPITLEHPLQPESSYAISKTAGEAYVELSDLSSVSLRLANVYGPRGRSGPPPTFFSRLNEGRPCFVADTRRDFLYVQDLIEVVVKALAGTGQGRYHVSTGSDHSIKEMFEAIAGAMGIQPPPDVEVRPRTADDAPSILLDPSRTERDFGWTATVGLTEGVEKTIGYYREHGVDETFSHLRSDELRVAAPGPS